MSEITERTNIMSIDEVSPVGEDYGSIGVYNGLATYQSVNSILSNIQSFIPGDVLGALNATSNTLKFANSNITISCPNTLRASFMTKYSPTTKIIESLGINPITAKKASLLLSLSKMDFKVSQSISIRNGLQAVLHAKEAKTLNAEIKSVMRELESAHTEVFVRNLAKACANASFNVGFKMVEIKNVESKLEVIGTNQSGQRIISEISLDLKTNQVYANTETIGIIDGSCSRVITQFNEELKKMNIKIGHEKTLFTGGISQMGYAKILDKLDKESLRQKKEQERTKKMNANYKQKN